MTPKNCFEKAEQKQPKLISKNMRYPLINFKNLSSLIFGLALLPLITPLAFSLPSITGSPTGNVKYSTHWTNTGLRVMDVNVTGLKAILNESSFNILSNEVVNFNFLNLPVPNGRASILNNVLPIFPTSIYGAIHSNGGVIISNAAGTFIAPSASINAQSLVLSSSPISNKSYLSDNYIFQRSGVSSPIINKGSIEVNKGGFVLMIGSNVINEGQIIAPEGQIRLAVGDNATAKVSNNVLVDFKITKGLKQAIHYYDDAIQNTGTLQANGGLVQLQATILNGVYRSAVNNSGRIIAQATVANGGTVELLAGKYDGVPIIPIDYPGNRATIYNSGLIDTSGVGKGKTGGVVNILGNDIRILGNTQINATGTNGGGTINIGGSIKHLGQGLSQFDVIASNVVIGPATDSAKISLLANALEQGPGGNITIASQHDIVMGHMPDIKLDVQGGPKGGPAGQVTIFAGGKITLY